jgi:hypothetical protein
MATVRDDAWIGVKVNLAVCLALDEIDGDILDIFGSTNLTVLDGRAYFAADRRT